MATVDQLTNNLVPTNKGVAKPVANTVKNLLASPAMKKRFEEVLGSKASGYLASVASLSAVALKDVEPNSIAAAAFVSATLDLPINPNLGFAYLVPFNEKQENNKYIKKAQFQLGYKGFIQLALRTGQYKNINVVEVYEGQLKDWNPLTEEIEFDFKNKESEKIVGYASYFKLVNGFEKTTYWSIEDVKTHAEKFSKTYKSKYGVWANNFNEMAKKTVLKNTLSKWGILSIEMQTAMITDQGVIKEAVLDSETIENVDVSYSDNDGFIDVDIKEEDSTPEVKKEVIDGQVSIEDSMK